MEEGFQVSYYINRYSKTPNMDTLHTGTLKHYTSNNNQYRPYTQFKIATTDQQVIVNLVTFEAICHHDSVIKLIIDKNSLLSVELFGDGTFKVFIDSNDITLNCNLHFTVGEDLQGVFWGGIITIPTDFLKGISTVNGNVLKYGNHTNQHHSGSYFQGNQLGEFTIINKD